MTAMLLPWFQCSAIHYKCTRRATFLRQRNARSSKCQKKHLHISCLEHKTNNWVQSKPNFLVGPREHLLATVKRRKFARFGLTSHAMTTSLTPSSGRLGVWMTSRSAEEMLDGKRHTADVRAHARTADDVLQQKKKRTRRLSLLNCPSCPSRDPIGEVTELKTTLSRS